MWCVRKMRMGRAQFPSELVQRVMPNEDAVRHLQHAIVCVELFNGGTPASRISLSEDLLKVSIEKFDSWFSHFCPPPTAIRSTCPPTRGPDMA
jgi:hypothetical protein